MQSSQPFNSGRGFGAGKAAVPLARNTEAARTIGAAAGPQLHGVPRRDGGPGDGRPNSRMRNSQPSPQFSSLVAAPAATA